MKPLISVTIPCYNSANTLPVALASLLAQTYTNWECIVVDDGSNDRPFNVVEIINDERIQFHRFNANRGRATARQQALDMAQGDYLCMIDADDWIYPWKIERQVEVVEMNSDIAVLSTGMTMVDTTNNILAIRMPNHQPNKSIIRTSLKKPMLPPFAHAPSIIRMRVAKEAGYDSQFTISEDVDFLLRIIMHHQFGILPEITYVYSEIVSYNLEKILESMRTDCKIFSKFKMKYPYAVYANYIKLILKMQIYRTSFVLGIDKYLVRNRSQKPTSQQIRDFQNARQIVYDIGKNVFENTPYESVFEI